MPPGVNQQYQTALRHSGREAGIQARDGNVSAGIDSHGSNGAVYQTFRFRADRRQSPEGA